MMNPILILVFIALVGCKETKVIEGEKPIIVYRQPAGNPPPIQPRPPGQPSFVTLDRLEEIMLLDLNNITSDNERQRTRYLIGCDRTNQGLETDEFEQGVNLALNGLSNERFLTKSTKIGAEGCIYRFDLDDFTITRSEWVQIERALLLDFVSKTTRNENLQFLTQALKPYAFATDFVTTVYEGDAVASGTGLYYDLIDQPDLTHNFFLQQGIVVGDEVLDENALFAGFSQSLIALGKTRLLQVIESNNGFCLSTFDVANEANSDDLFQNPFSKELAFAGGSNRIFDHVAQEHYCTAPNGMFTWRLNNAADIAEVVAPGNVVVNLGNERIDASIRIGDCFSCHGIAGAIPFKDQVGQFIVSNPGFNENEKKLAQIFFRGDKISAVINEINRRYAVALEELDITAEKDPLSQIVVKPFRSELDANQVAAFTFLSTEQFLERLKGTAISSQVFGSLLGGGKVNLATLSANFGTLVDEMLLFQDIEI